jgi:hypothetical protein
MRIDNLSAGFLRFTHTHVDNILSFGKRSSEFEERLCDPEEIFDLALFLSVNLEIRIPILSTELIERGLEPFSPSKH